jgi:phosphate transport system substrate-binding protein
MSLKRCLLAAAAILAIGAGGATADKALKGKVAIDGSSTVFPISEAVAEEFMGVQPKIRVTIGVSGTGGGFKKFLVDETDINDASRPIKSKEAAKAIAAGIEYIELPVAYDGITVVVHPANDWVDHFTVEELHQIWMPGSKVKKWADVRAGWPDREIKLYGPGTDSGTFDYFTEAINGESQVCRADFTASEDDNVLVQGVAGDKDALGFFGFAYYIENTGTLKAVPIDDEMGEDGPVLPSMSSISGGGYTPLSRPIFIYINARAAERPEVESFVRFYIESAPELVGEVGYVALPRQIYELVMTRFERRITGSVYETGAQGSLAELFSIQ